MQGLFLQSVQSGLGVAPDELQHFSKWDFLSGMRNGRASCLHLLPSWISSYLKLPFRTQGRSWRLNEACFLQTRRQDRGGGTLKAFCAQEPHGALLGFRTIAVEGGLILHKADG